MLAEHETRVEAPRTRRKKLPWSFVIAGVAIAGAVFYLVMANTSTTAEYYLTIHELRVCTTCSSRAIRVAGIVAPNSIVRDNATQAVHFIMSDSAETMPVQYSGVVPDIFRPGIQVVVEGHLVNGVFQAQNLLAKCPSKFQSATPPAGGGS